MLPTLPTLPARLRLSDSDDEEDEDVEDERDEDHDAADARHPQADYLAYTSHHHLAQPSTHHSHGPTLPTAQHHPHPYSDELPAAPTHFDAVLTDLMSRYRARKQARTSDTPAQASNTPQPSRHHQQQRRQGGGRQPDPHEDEEAEEERAELMAHLMGKLRKEVLRAEEEGWMFGEPGPATVEGSGLMSGGGFVGVGIGAEGA